MILRMTSRGNMAKHARVTLEIGPKSKKVVAVAPDWPGLERGASTGDAATKRLLAYLPRYATVTKLAGMEAAFTRWVDVQEAKDLSPEALKERTDAYIEAWGASLRPAG